MYFISIMLLEYLCSSFNAETTNGHISSGNYIATDLNDDVIVEFIEYESYNAPFCDLIRFNIKRKSLTFDYYLPYRKFLVNTRILIFVDDYQYWFDAMISFHFNNIFLKKCLHLKYQAMIPNIATLIITLFDNDFKHIIPFYVTMLFTLVRCHFFDITDHEKNYCLIFRAEFLKTQNYTGFNLEKSIIYTALWWKAQNMNMSTFYDVHKSLAEFVFKLLINPHCDKRKILQCCNAFKKNIFMSYQYFGLIS